MKTANKPDKNGSPTHPHNTVRIDVELSHVGYMIDDGEVNLARLRQRLLKAVEKIVNEEVQWDPRSIFECDDDYLAHDVISYDLS